MDQPIHSSLTNSVTKNGSQPPHGQLTTMAAGDGGDRPIRPAKTPKLSLFIYLLSLMAVLGGFQCGYNTGIISSAMLHVVNSDAIRPVSHVWQEMIVAAMPIFAAVGALFAGKLGDSFGRRKMILTSTLVFGVGALVCASAFSKPALLVGRVLLGFALGVSSMIVPIYVGECSPTHVRGQMLSAFNIFLCFGQMAANMVAGCFSYVDADNVGWRLMFGFAALPAFVQFVGFLFLPESPRWLYSNGGEKKCRSVLNKIYDRNKAWVEFELAEISAVHDQELASRARSGAINQNTFLTVMRTPHVRKALFIGTAAMAFNQLSGVDVIMYYTAPLLKSAGVHNDHTVIWLSLGTSFVNFTGTVIPFFLIERYGRRCVLLASTAASAVGLVLLGTSFLVVNRDTFPTVAPTTMERISFLDKMASARDEGVLHHCLSKSNCDYCVTDDRCGFCALAGAQVGLCLPLNVDAPGESATGYCSGGGAITLAAAATTTTTTANASSSFSSFEWSSVTCKTQYTLLPLALMVVYLLCFAIGLSTIPWVLNAEFYPLWARGTCGSIGTCALWTANAFVSLTFLSLAATISRYGTFYMYAVITSFAFCVFWRYVPDTSGYSIDEIEFLFMSPHQRQKQLAALQAQVARRESVAHERTSISNNSDELSDETALEDRTSTF